MKNLLPFSMTMPIIMKKCGHLGSILSFILTLIIPYYSYDLLIYPIHFHLCKPQLFIPLLQLFPHLYFTVYYFVTYWPTFDLYVTDNDYCHLFFLITFTYIIL